MLGSGFALLSLDPVCPFAFRTGGVRSSQRASGGAVQVPAARAANRVIIPIPSDEHEHYCDYHYEQGNRSEHDHTHWRVSQ